MYLCPIALIGIKLVKVNAALLVAVCVSPNAFYTESESLRLPVQAMQFSVVYMNNHRLQPI